MAANTGKNDRFKIRPFNRADIDKIMDIELQAFPKTAYPREDFLTFARNLPEGFVVIESGRDLAGYIVFDRGGHILSMAVSPQYRRKGLGTALFRHALQQAGMRLLLEVRSQNKGAISFYKKMGMRTAAKISNYYGDDDAFVLVITPQP